MTVKMSERKRRKTRGAKIVEGLPVEAAGSVGLPIANCQLQKKEGEEERRKEGRSLIAQRTLPGKAGNSKVCQKTECERLNVPKRSNIKIGVTFPSVCYVSHNSTDSNRCQGNATLHL